MSAERIAQLQTSIEAHLGLRLEPAAAAALLARHGDALLDRVEDPVALRALTAELTVGETYFFRHLEQIHAYRDAALPDRLARSAGPVRVLSAGCSTGEEPYTLAILAAESLDRVEVTGIELNPVSIARAARARYTRWSLRALPVELERRWFTKAGAEYQLAPELRDAVTFQRANLADAATLPVQHYDIVFCRNVLMYFTAAAARGVIQRLVRSLVPGGYLFLGHVDVLHERVPGLAPRESHGTFYYQRVDNPAPDSLDITWFAAIEAASQRIRALAERAPAIATPVFDLTSALAEIRALLAQEDFTGALAALDQLPTSSAHEPEVLLLRAVALTEHGDPDRASAACDALLEVPVHAASAHYLHAVRRESGGDLAGALRHAERATQLAPEFAIGHLRFGLLARRTGDRARARTELVRAIEAFPVENPPRLALHAGGLGREQLIRLCRAELAAIDAEAAPMIQTAADLRRAFDASFADPYPDAAGAQIGLLLLSIENTAYALALEQIGAVQVDLRIGPVPSRERTLIGLATVRNVIIPVHDLAVALGLRVRPAAARWTVLTATAPVRAWAFDQFEGQIRIDRAARSNGTIEIAGRSRRVLDLEELTDAA